MTSRMATRGFEDQAEKGVPGELSASPPNSQNSGVTREREGEKETEIEYQDKEKMREGERDEVKGKCQGFERVRGHEPTKYDRAIQCISVRSTVVDWYTKDICYMLYYISVCTLYLIYFIYFRGF
jgi:hypothetical protein